MNRAHHALVLAATGWLIASAGWLEARQLAIAVRAGSPSVRMEIERELPASWPSIDPVAWFTDGQVEVLVSPNLAPVLAQDLFTQARILEKTLSDVLVAGELKPSPTGPLRVYSGYVLIEYGTPANLNAVLAWATSHSFTAQQPNPRRNHVLVEGPGQIALLAGLLNQLPSGVLSKPILYEFTHISPLDPWDIGGSHLIPHDRNRLAVQVAPKADPDCHLTIIGNTGGTIDNTDDPDLTDDVHFVTLANESDMMEALLALLDRPDCASWVGPVLSDDPIRVLTGELVVDFTSAGSRRQAQAILNEHDLVQTRELPYLEHGYLFRRELDGTPQPSYALYGAASELLAAGHARLAVPNILSENRPQSNGACREQNSCPCTDSTCRCDPNVCQPYLQPIDASAAWSTVSAMGTGSTVIGLLDGGFHDDPKLCSELRVKALQNSARCATASCLAAVKLCESDPDNWCLACGALNMPHDSHAMQMALIAAAKRENGDPTFRCCDFLGMANGNPLINVAHALHQSSTDVADALWWMSGGDPLEPVYYQNTVSGDASSVIALPFSRVFAPTEDCQDLIVNGVTTLDCVEICGEGNDCSVIDAVLKRIRRGGDPVREGGVLVVNAMGAWGLFDNDYDEHSATVAVGTVGITNLLPFGPSLYPITNHETYVDLVVPMGPDGSIDFGLGPLGGDTSAAAAAVSGIAAMMFDVHPHMTAAQAHCILQTTADDAAWDAVSPAQLEGFDPLGVAWGPCGFSNGDSPCFGHGMADAGAAVAAAAACKRDSDWAVLYDSSAETVTGFVETEWTPEGQVILDVRAGDLLDVRTGDLKVISLNQDWGTLCPCDDEGNEIPNDILFTQDSVSFCLRCTDEPEGQPSVQSVMEIIWAVLRCIDAGLCRCERFDPTCVNVDVVNTLGRDFRNVRAQICNGEDCRDIILDRRFWRIGEKLRATFPPIDDDFARFLKKPGRGKLELRLYSGKHRIDLGAPVRIRRLKR